MAYYAFKWAAAVLVLCFQTGLILSGSDSVNVMSFYRAYIYTHILKGLGDPKLIRDAHHADAFGGTFTTSIVLSL
jgi:hypothetical protein